MPVTSFVVDRQSKINGSPDNLEDVKIKTNNMTDKDIFLRIKINILISPSLFCGFAVLKSAINQMISES